MQSPPRLSRRGQANDSDATGHSSQRSQMIETPCPPMAPRTEDKCVIDRSCRILGPRLISSRLHPADLDET